MADKSIHIEQALHNKKLAQELCEDDSIDYRDWVVTICFYSAIHFVEAWMATKPNLKGTKHIDDQLKNKLKNKKLKDNRHLPSLHGIRKTVFSEHFEEVKKSYKHLQTMSYQARYITKGKVAFEYFTDEVARRCLNDFLSDIIEATGYDDIERKELCS